jgi:ZIP family zinc transporter
MLEAVLAAGISALGLYLGFLIATKRVPSQLFVGLAMALGSGLLMAEVAYGLVLETVETTGEVNLVGISFAAGALVYYIGDRLIAAKYGEGGGLGIALGAALDGVPESIVMGISVATFGDPAIALVIGAFVSNIAEGIGGTASMVESGFAAGRTQVMWLAIAGASVLSAMVGYEVLASVAKNNGAVFSGFAAGSLLTVIANALIPEGYERAGRLAGLIVVLGFGIGFALEYLQ